MYDLDNDDGLLYEWCLCGIYVGCFYDGGGWGVIGFYIEFIFELWGWCVIFLDWFFLYGECYCWDWCKFLVGKMFW